MAETIRSSVGRDGVNEPDDKRTISRLLGAISTLEGGTLPPIVVSPLRGEDRDLTGAIENFQKRQFSGRSDARVDPNGNTLRRMNEKAVLEPKPDPGVSIRDSVGRQPARNEPSDADRVIDLLSRVLTSDGGPDGPIFRAPLPGVSSPTLVAAIEKFQRHHFNGFSDGRVDPRGKTLRLLNKLTGNGTGPKRTLQTVPLISGSVGRPPANNIQTDQARIIALLLTVPPAEGGPGPVAIPVGVLPGQASSQLIDAIVAFQKRQFQGFSDGRVDPNGKTLERLFQKQVIRVF